MQLSLFLVPPLALLGILAFGDLCQRKLRNSLVILYAASFVLLAPIGSIDLKAIEAHALVGLIAFLFFFVLFALGIVGGGDVKLGTAALLWSGPSLAFPTVAIIAWAGGILAVLGWLVDRKAYQRLTWRPARCVGHALSARRGVPYGVALACGGWFVVWQQYQSLGKI